MPVAALTINIFFGSIGNVLFFLCLRKIGLNQLNAVLFTGILALSFPHLLFGSIPETYIFVFTSLVLLFALFLFVNRRKTFFISFLPASLFSIGITATNVVFVVILFFRKMQQQSGFRRAILHLVAFCVLVAITLSGLILLQKRMYPLQKDVFASTTISSNVEFLSIRHISFSSHNSCRQTSAFFPLQHHCSRHDPKGSHISRMGGGSPDHNHHDDDLFIVHDSFVLDVLQAESLSRRNHSGRCLLILVLTSVFS